jgi:hypothetical protein
MLLMLLLMLLLLRLLLLLLLLLHSVDKSATNGNVVNSLTVQSAAESAETVPATAKHAFAALH